MVENISGDDAASSMSAPALSIVVPTRDRAECARATIDSLLAIEGDIQVVVHDNSSDDALEKWYATREADRRLVYAREPVQLSFVENFERAVAYASGEYVCIIGDDDTVHQEIMAVVRWASALKLEAVVPLPVCTYIWPGAGAGSRVIPAAETGLLTVVPFTGDVTVARVDDEIRRLLRSGGLYYLDFRIPKLYHGVVARRKLEEIRVRSGAVFGGLSPDTYAAFALACVCERVAYIDFPVTVPGASRTSGSVQEGALRQHSRDLARAPHLVARGAYNWNDLIPRIYSVETLWVDSGLSALRSLGRADLLAEFNLAEFTAKCASANPDVATKVRRAYFQWERAQGRSWATSVPPLLAAQAGSWLKSTVTFIGKVWARLQRQLGVQPWWRAEHVPDTKAVVLRLSAHLSETGAKLRLPLKL